MSDSGREHLRNQNTVAMTPPTVTLPTEQAERVLRVLEWAYGQHNVPAAGPRIFGMPMLAARECHCVVCEEIAASIADLKTLGL